MNAPRRNIECKASDPDSAGSLAVCHTLGAEDHGRDSTARHLFHGAAWRAEAYSRITKQPGITIPRARREDGDQAELSLPRSLPGLFRAGKRRLQKKGRGWYPVAT